MPADLETPNDTRSQQWLLNGYNGSIERDLDMVRSQLGAYLTTTSTTQTVVLSCPTGKTLHLDTLVVNCSGATTGGITFYDSTSTTTPVFKVQVGATSSLFVTGIKGITFTTGIYMLQESSFDMSVRVGCIVRDS